MSARAEQGRFDGLVPPTASDAGLNAPSDTMLTGIPSTTTRATSPCCAGDATCSSMEGLTSSESWRERTSRELYERGGIRPYYSDDSCIVLLGDCRELLPLIDPVEVVLTDPPYGVQLNFGDGSADTQELFVKNCEWLAGLGVPTAFTVPSTKMFDIPRPQWVGVWHKPMTFGYWSTPLIPHWEPVVFYGMPIGGKVSDHWTCNPQKPNGHPTPKPEKLWREVLAGMPDGVVVDPFMGSGTTLRAAKDLGRKAIGIEIEEKYCHIAAKRLEQSVLQFGDDQPVIESGVRHALF